MKKIQPLHIVFCDFDDISNPLLGAGQAHATVEVGSRLAQMGHQVTVLSHRFPGCKDRTEHGIQYVHIGIGTSNIRVNNLLYILSIPFAVAKVRADIIVECFTAPISTLCTQLFTKIPVVGLPTSFDAERFSALYHLPFTWIQNLGLKTYKYFMPYTTLLEEKFRIHNTSAKTRVIPEGVSEEYLTIKKLKPKHILFLGRFDIDQKGIDLLLHAYAKVKSKIAYPLVLAGYGPDEAKIRSLVTELNLSEKVQFVGGAFGETKKKLLAEAVAVAFPSRNEGFSLFSLEALAAGLPLLAFDIPGLCWAPTSICAKAQPFEIDEYAKILLLANDADVMNAMSHDARETAKTYTWDSVANQWNEFFQEIHAEQRTS